MTAFTKFLAIVAAGSISSAASAKTAANLLEGVWAVNCGQAVSADNPLTVYMPSASADTMLITSISTGPNGIVTSTYPAKVAPEVKGGMVAIDFVHDATHVNHATLDLRDPQKLLIDHVVDESGHVSTDHGIYISSGKPRTPFQRCSAPDLPL